MASSATPELDAVAARAEGEWPGLVVDREAFVAWVRERVSGSRAPLSLDTLPAGDLLIAWSAARGEPRALQAFETRFLAEVPRYVRHLDASAAFGSDIVQAVRIRLLVAEPGTPPRLAGYAGQGSLAAFVKICAVRLALDLRRGGDHRAVDTETIDLVPAGEDVELDYIRARYRGAFEDALRQAFLGCTAEERTALRLLYLDHVAVGAIANLYGVAISTMSRRLTSLREGLRERTREALNVRFGSSPGELSSLVRLLDSRMEMSLQQFLSDSEHFATK